MVDFKNELLWIISAVWSWRQYYDKLSFRITYYWPFVRGKHWWSVGSTHERLGNEAFPCHDVIIQWYSTTRVVWLSTEVNAYAWKPGDRINIKVSSYHQYRNFHCGDKTILRPSYLHNEISYTDKMTSLYWIRAQHFFFSNLVPMQTKCTWLCCALLLCCYTIVVSGFM